MPQMKTPTRVVAIAEPGPIQEQIRSALSSDSEFQLLDVLQSLERVIPEIRAAQPNMIVLDHQVGDESTLDTVDAVALQFPEIAIVAILPSDNLVRAQQALLAGVRTFLVQPFTQDHMLATLRRVRDLETRRAQFHAEEAARAAEGSEPVRILTVFSPRGGVGCSTLAANLALALRDQTAERVLLMDGKLLFGHIGLMLNVRTPNSIADLIPHAATLDNELVGEVVAEHASGVHVLPRPSELEVAQGIRPEDLFNVLAGVSRMYDFIVIDAGSTLNEITVTLMDAADRILLVATPDLAALHDVSQFVQVSASLAYPQSKLLVILNRAGMMGGVKTHDVESALHHQVFAQIPEDGPNALRSVNRGIPLMMKYPRKPVSRAIQRLARSLAEMAEAESAGEAASSGALRTRARARVRLARAG